jgi:rRNA-processing protein FCF1
MQLEGMDIGPRRRMLDQIRASNPVLHAAVMQELRNLRASNEAAGREQGRAQLRQQQ